LFHHRVIGASLKRIGLVLPHQEPRLAPRSWRRRQPGARRGRAAGPQGQGRTTPAYHGVKTVQGTKHALAALLRRECELSGEAAV